MLCGELSGSHKHESRTGKCVHIWRRGNVYLARGRHEGRAFGKTLGKTEQDAAAALRHLLCTLENGSFVPPSEENRSQLRRQTVSNLLYGSFSTTFSRKNGDFVDVIPWTPIAIRLTPVLDFAERVVNLKRWPLARNIDREFVTNLRVALHQMTTTRNGRRKGTLKPFSSTHIINIMETFRTALNWAQSAPIRKLPIDWSNPLTADIVGLRPSKDPLRVEKLPMSTRSELVPIADIWELSILSLSMILPLRPEEATGILVTDVDFENCWFSIGSRLGGADVTKGVTSFKLPFPVELELLLKRCIGNRKEGPLLRCRKDFGGTNRYARIQSREELVQAFEDKLADEPPGTVQTAQDRKRVFRRLLAELGGATPSTILAKQFERLCWRGGITGVSIKDLRSSVSSEMERSGMDFLHLRYLTSHAINDIMNDYVALDPSGAMAKYFATIQPLLDEVAERICYFGI